MGWALCLVGAVFDIFLLVRARLFYGPGSDFAAGSPWQLKARFRYKVFD